MSRYTSADAFAETAHAPTAEQLAFDAHSKAVEGIVREMRLITQVGYMWPTKAEDRISRMVELASDLRRELSVLAIQGYRPTQEGE
jgi:hypothetical protein